MVDFNKINELISQRRVAAHGAVEKAAAPATDKDGKAISVPEGKVPEADKQKKRQGRPPKEPAEVSREKGERGRAPHR